MPNSAVNYKAFVKETEALRSALGALKPPPDLAGLHLDAQVYLDKVVQWLTLERDYHLTANDPKRVQANDMIPEIDARSILLRRAIIGAEYEYQLQSN